MAETGPVLVPSVAAGDDRIWVIDRNGATALAGVKSIEADGEADAWRLLTSAGDVVVPSDALAMTDRGPMTGAELERAVRDHKVIRLDVVIPSDLPPPRKRSVRLKDVYRSCFAALPGNVIQLPRDNGVAAEFVPPLVELLKKAGVAHTSVEDERWIGLILEPIEADLGAARARFSHQADLLAMLTAWSGDLGECECRIRMDDCTLRRRLLASLAGAARSFSVAWLPGYYPVESRIRVASERPWPARVPVQGATALTARTLRVETEADGDPIVSLAVLRCTIST